MKYILITLSLIFSMLASAETPPADQVLKTEAVFLKQPGDCPSCGALLQPGKKNLACSKSKSKKSCAIYDQGPKPKAPTNEPVKIGK